MSHTTVKKDVMHMDADLIGDPAVSSSIPRDHILYEFLYPATLLSAEVFS